MRIALAMLSSRKVLPLGMLYIASVLREHGHQVLWREATSGSRLVGQLRRDRVDLVGFSATTGMHTVYLDWAADVRRALGVRTLFGGAHPTFVPTMIDHPDVDALVMGEAEHTVAELLPQLRATSSQEPVAGAWYKAARGPERVVIRAPVRPPPDNLDELPSPAFDLIYDRYPERDKLAARRLRLGAIVLAALGLGAASAFIDACKSLAAPPSAGDTPQEGPPIVPMGSAPVVVSAVPPPTSSPPTAPDGPDASSEVQPDAPAEAAAVPRYPPPRDAGKDARRGRLQDANVIYE
jgi:hypothetical protein